MGNKSALIANANNSVCSVSLSDFEDKKNLFEFIDETDLKETDLVTKLVMFSPSRQSNLGKKLSKKISKHIDEIALDLKKGLDLKNIYAFTAYVSSNKDEIKKKVLTDNSPFLLLYVDSGFVESLYASIRNALAHGNIVKKNGAFFLYSVSKHSNRNPNEKEKDLSFLLRVHSLKKLNTYIEVFEKYN